MKILMDLLAIQSEGSRGRGIGRYSEELSQEILKMLPKDVKIALSALYPEHKDEILEEYKNLIQEDEIQEYAILDTADKPFQEKEKYNKLNSYLIKNQLTQNAEIDILHFHSIFEGLVGKADTIEEFSELKNLKTALTLYDLIPLIYKDVYLADPSTKKWYYNKLKPIYEADLLLAISDATREDAINILGVNPSKVVSISGAIDAKKFYKMDINEKNAASSILKKYAITQPYILYTGGIDFRKNIDASIRAFAQIDPKHRDNHQYLIVCKISPAQKETFLALLKEIGLPKNKVVFTGFVTDEELNFLYNAASLFIFPSIYEGFGLPVLEAMSCAKVVLGSNVSSIPEIIGKEECMFDPANIQEIASKINYVLDNPQLKTQLEEYFYARSKEFSWQKSAKITLDAYQNLLNHPVPKIQKIKIAFFSPLPDKRSGISDYSLELLPFLSKYFDIDIYVDDYQVQDEYLCHAFPIYSYKYFEPQKAKYDNVIYQFGNSEFHEYMYDIALNNPGVIVLHDFFLSGLVNYIANKRDDSQFFFDNLGYSHPEERKKKMLSQSADVAQIIKTLPINKKIIDAAKAIIVHSNYAKELFKEYYAHSYEVHVINQLVKTPSPKSIDKKEKTKQLLGYQNSDILITAFGHVTDTKQYDFILECFIEKDIFQNKNIHLVFVGDFVSQEYKYAITSLIKKRKLDRVKITGFVNDALYKEYLLASDIAINLRVDSRGETSRAQLMNMAYALPTIINDYASFSELPDEVTAKVALNKKEDFAAKLIELIENKPLREKMAQAAYNHIQAHHGVDEAAKSYYDVTLAYTSFKEPNKSILKDIAAIIANNALDAHLTPPEYLALANIIKNNLKATTDE